MMAGGFGASGMMGMGGMQSAFGGGMPAMIVPMGAGGIAMGGTASGINPLLAALLGLNSQTGMTVSAQEVQILRELMARAPAGASTAGATGLTTSRPSEAEMEARIRALRETLDARIDDEMAKMRVEGLRQVSKMSDAINDLRGRVQKLEQDAEGK